MFPSGFRETIIVNVRSESEESKKLIIAPLVMILHQNGSIVVANLQIHGHLQICGGRGRGRGVVVLLVDILVRVGRLMEKMSTGLMMKKMNLMMMMSGGSIVIRRIKRDEVEIGRMKRKIRRKRRRRRRRIWYWYWYWYWWCCCSWS